MTPKRRFIFGMFVFHLMSMVGSAPLGNLPASSALPLGMVISPSLFLSHIGLIPFNDFYPILMIGIILTVALSLSSGLLVAKCRFKIGLPLVGAFSLVIYSLGTMAIYSMI